LGSSDPLGVLMALPGSVKINPILYNLGTLKAFILLSTMVFLLSLDIRQRDASYSFLKSSPNTLPMVPHTHMVHQPYSIHVNVKSASAVLIPVNPYSLALLVIVELWLHGD